jgi:hypothetical protein
MKLAALCAAAALLPATAHAALLLDFEADMGPFIGSLTVQTEELAFHGGPATVTACTAVGCEVDLYRDAQVLTTLGDVYDVVGVKTATTTYHWYYFENGALETPGEHQSVLLTDRRATLRVDGAAAVAAPPPPPAVVPEPGTWALMILGFGLAGANLRARVRVPS